MQVAKRPVHILKKLLSPPLSIPTCPFERRLQILVGCKQQGDIHQLLPACAKSELCLFPRDHLRRIGLISSVPAIELGELLVRNLQGLWMRNNFVP